MVHAPMSFTVETLGANIWRNNKGRLVSGKTLLYPFLIYNGIESTSLSSIKIIKFINPGFLKCKFEILKTR